MAHGAVHTDAQLRHLDVAKRALQRGWIDLEGLRAALRLVGRGDDSVHTVWVESGVLTASQVERILLDADQGSDKGDDGAFGADATLIHYRKPTSSSQPRGGVSPANPPDDPATSSLAETVFPRSRSGDQAVVTEAVNVNVNVNLNGARDAPDLSGDLAALSVGEVSDRYVIEEQIGRGGSGRVFRAFDRALGRVVALKVLRSDHSDDAGHRIQRFISEARATGRLEHPNIIPIYDVGLLPDGQAYYTMKLLRRQSLRQVLRALAAQDERIRREYPLSRLLHLFLPVCQAIGYAHAQHIVHRDLKPDNIVLGEYGEVLVTDWGLARLLEDPAEELEDELGQPGTLGTPAYMPPEQAQGRLAEVDELSDIYALGAILYELLTLQPPFEGPTAQAVLDAVATGRLVPPTQRAVGRHVPRDLEEVCLRAMDPDRSRRYPTAIALHDDVARFLEGQQDRESRRKVYMARTSSREYFRSLDEIDALDADVRRLRDLVSPSAPPDDKRALWDTQDELARLEVRLAQSFSDSVRAFTQALAYDPDSAAALRGLADLYWSRFQRAEARREILDKVHYANLIRQVDRDGAFAALLEGDGALELSSQPPGAQVTLLRYREVGRVLETREARSVGTTPLALERLEMGSYLALVEAPGYETARYPFRITRSGRWRGHVALLRPGQLPEGFCYVPSGLAVLGGDADALDAAPERLAEVRAFGLARDHVTFADYLAFLDAVQAHDPAQAQQRAPQARDGDGLLAELQGGRWVPKPILIEGEARQRYPLGAGFEWQLPVMCIGLDDALAYLAWRSQRDGRRYRLPTADEWEKAARGVDGRSFPWGNRFDATFCKMRLSRPEMPQPEPIGAFPLDVSVYGVRDLAGTIQDWCRDETWQAPADDPRGEHAPESCRVGGGAWNSFEDACRAASRVRVLSVGRSVAVGLRLAVDVDGPAADA